MTGRRFALIVGLSLLVMVVAINLAAGVWLRTARLDLTEHRLYSLAEGSRQVLRELREPMTLTFYYSRNAAAEDPQLAAFAGRVRELLQTFQARSRGRLRVVEVNPAPFSEQEEQARLAGLQPRTPANIGDPIFLGLAGANAVDDRRAIPFLDPTREAFLEYDLTRLIYDLDNPDPVKVALITSLPIDPAAGEFAQGQSVFAVQLGALMDVEKLAPDFSAIPEDADLVAVIHPWALTQAQLFALDQFILAKGRAFIALDPASVLSLAPPAMDPFSPQPPAPASSLAPLLSAWGVAMSDDVVLDRQGGFLVPASDPAGRQITLPYPVFLQVTADRLDRESIVTASLERDIVFGLAGALSASERPGLTATVLARTSGETMRLPAQAALAQPDPIALDQNWMGVAKAETLALALSGRLTTAFPNGPPAEAGVDSAVPRLIETAAPAEVIIVSDTDFLVDQFYVDPNGSGFVFDNLFFALNAIDRLGGDEALISLRSRAPAVRRMTLVDDLEQSAREAYQRRLESVEAEQRATEERLAVLQSRGEGSGFFRGDPTAELTAEEQTELNRFLLRAQELGQEVRTIRGQLRQEVDQLEALVVGLNLWLAPLGVAIAGLFVFTRRGRRPRPAASQRGAAQ